MGDLEEAKRLLGEILKHKDYAADDNIHEDSNNVATHLGHIEESATDALDLLENMEDKIKDVIADMDWRGLHNDAIILRRLKDIIPPRTSEEETERMKMRWPKKSPPKE